MESITEATQTQQQQLNDALRNQTFKPEEMTFSYVKAGGKCFNFELFTMNVLVESLGGFNPLDVIKEGVEVTPQGLVDVAIVFM